MKKLLSVFVVFTAFFAFCASIKAQSTVMRPAVAFVKASRDTLFIKQTKQADSPDSAVQPYYLPDLINSIAAGDFVVDSIRQLAVIGMTPKGDRMVLGGKVVYYDQNSAFHIYKGLFSIPWPLSTFNPSGNSIYFLLQASSTINFRPVGILSADGSQWWAVLQSNSGGDDSIKFYHGRTDGSGTIDSTTFPTKLAQGVQMSNIALDKTNNTMLAMSYDQLYGDQRNAGRVRFYNWHAGQNVDESDIQGTYNTIAGVHIAEDYDSAFGLTVIPNNDGSTALIGMTPDPGNAIQFYTIAYTSTIELTTPVNQIPRTAIPAAQNFFAGSNCPTVNYNEDVVGKGGGQSGNSGDVSINTIGGDSILFVTHETDQNCSDRNLNSAIYMYDLSANTQTAQLIYNDQYAQELQPVWVVAPYTIPAYPGVNWQAGTTGNFNSLDTGKTSTLNITFSDTSKVDVTVDSATITGANASEFTITSGSVATSLKPTDTKQISVSFKPVAPAGAVSAMLNVYFEGKTSQDTIKQPLSGTVTIPTNGVKEDAVLAAGMLIDPNPFSTIASVQLTAPDAGAFGIVVHDALGRTVYTSELRETGAGNAQTFQFDAKSLGLPDGVYYVTAFLGERQASRAVVFAR
jgi:hypothetical protein